MEVGIRIAIKNSAASKLGKRKKLSNEDVNFLKDLYIDQEISAKEICRIMNAGHETVRRWLGEAGIPIRNVKESKQSERHKNKRRGNKCRWSGGIIKDSGGYIRVYRPRHHYADGAGYVAQHIVVIEEVLGRPIRDGEIVHHINKNRSDNRPCNLALCSGPHGHSWAHSKDAAMFFGNANVYFGPDSVEDLRKEER